MAGSFDIILPAYKNTDKVRQSLKGFEAQTAWDDANTIFLCINGDPDPFMDLLEEDAWQNSPLRIVPLYFEDRQNHGRAANRNQPLDQLTSAYVLYHDSDLVPSPTLLEEHLRFLEASDCVSVGMVEYSNRSTNVWANYQYHSGRAKYKHGQVIPPHYLNTQNVAMHREYLLAAKGQWEALTHYGGDDTELGFRLGKMYPDLPFRLNAKAITTGFMDKSLNKALSDVREFGQYNFPKIIERHPDFKDIYHIGRYLKEPGLRRIINLPVDKLVQSFQFLGPVKVVHYLTVKAVYKGLKLSGYLDKINS